MYTQMDSKSSNQANSEELWGIIVVDKEEGKTSTWVDNIIRRKLGTKVGHIGTIDPFASGVLPVAVGRATKLIPYLIDEDREYIAEILLGQKTDTDDITGKVIYKVDEELIGKIKIEQIYETLKKFEGIIEQVPPYFSARKYMGKRLYEWSRQGEYITLPPKKVTVYSIEVISISIPVIKLKITSSSGFYVRAMARDFGEILQVDGIKISATLKSLRRTRCSVFTEKDVIPSETLKKLTPEQLKKFVRKIDPEILDMAKIIVRDQELEKVKKGMPIKLKSSGTDGEYVAICDENSTIVAIGKISKNLVLIKRVI